MNLQNPTLLRTANLIDGLWVGADDGATLSCVRCHDDVGHQ